MLDTKGRLWNYLSHPQKDLIQQGFYLIEDLKIHVPATRITDFSFLVFPFAKAYEGFLKKLFLDMGFISRRQYESDYFRIGRVLSPGLAGRLKEKSVYTKLTRKLGDRQLADALWRVWKQGRNQVFHFFPHNLRALTQKEAQAIISDILTAMERAIAECESC